MSAGQMVQMNMRVQALDKRGAEESLALLGYSLTELVRGVLSKVARGAGDAEEVVRVISGGQSATDGVESAQSHTTLMFERLDRELEGMARRFGLDPASFPQMTDDELDEALCMEYFERERERLTCDA